MEKVEKQLKKVPLELQGHLPDFNVMSVGEKISFMKNDVLKKEWMEDVCYVQGFLSVTPSKKNIQKRKDELQKRENFV